MPEEPGGLGVRAGLQCSAPPPCRGAGEEHRRTLHGGARARQGAALRPIPRCRPELEPGRAHHRARRRRAEGTDTRFIVTNLEGGRAKQLYQRLYCARGQAENHIKAWKNHLAADRTSCHAADANQFRLFLHAGAYWLLWSMRRVMPKHSVWRVMQFDTLRLRLLKIAARVVELKTQVKIHLPSSAPDQAIFAMLLDRLPRLVT